MENEVKTFTMNIPEMLMINASSVVAQVAVRLSELAHLRGDPPLDRDDAVRHAFDWVMGARQMFESRFGVPVPPSRQGQP